MSVCNSQEKCEDNIYLIWCFIMGSCAKVPTCASDTILNDLMIEMERENL